MLSDEEKKVIEYTKEEYKRGKEQNNVLFPLYLYQAEIIINLIEKQQKEIEELKTTNKELTERVLRLESDKFWDNVVSKSKIKEIIYPTPENEIPIEIQQSEMYKKLVKEVEE